MWAEEISLFWDSTLHHCLLFGVVSSVFPQPGGLLQFLSAQPAISSLCWHVNRRRPTQNLQRERFIRNRTGIVSRAATGTGIHR